MQIIVELDPLRSAVKALRRDGTLAFVPTMGALHEGHLALVREGRKRAAHVAVSVFVNPRQFGRGEDLASYPRQLERDCELLRTAGVSLVWAPGVDLMYPIGYATNVSVSGVSEHLDGAARPGHFDGVATVLSKLFNQIRPDIALFGEKDWQQLAVIRRLASDLDLTHPHVGSIIGVPTVREADGLAMSSRNVYLTAEQRAQAVVLPNAMKAAIVALEAGHPVAPTLAALEQTLLTGGFASVDYVALRDAASLEPVVAVDEDPLRLLVAGRIGKTRLIDNMAVGRAVRVVSE